MKWLRFSFLGGVLAGSAPSRAWRKGVGFRVITPEDDEHGSRAAQWHSSAEGLDPMMLYYHDLLLQFRASSNFNTVYGPL